MSGYCFHIYTHFRFKNHFRPFPIPEIQRVPLEQMLLRIKIMPLFQSKRTVQDVLKNLIEPPANESVIQSLKRLRDELSLCHDIKNLTFNVMKFLKFFISIKFSIMPVLCTMHF